MQSPTAPLEEALRRTEEGAGRAQSSAAGEERNVGDHPSQSERLLLFLFLFPLAFVVI